MIGKSINLSNEKNSKLDKKTPKLDKNNEVFVLNKNIECNSKKDNDIINTNVSLPKKESKKKETKIKKIKNNYEDEVNNMVKNEILYSLQWQKPHDFVEHKLYQIVSGYYLKQYKKNNFYYYLIFI